MSTVSTIIAVSSPPPQDKHCKSAEPHPALGTVDSYTGQAICHHGGRRYKRPRAAAPLRMGCSSGSEVLCSHCMLAFHPSQTWADDSCPVCAQVSCIFYARWVLLYPLHGDGLSSSSKHLCTLQRLLPRNLLSTCLGRTVEPSRYHT